MTCKLQKLKDYTFDTFLGKGSFGTVYKGRNKQGEEVAIKCMDMKLFKEPFLIESLKNEINVMKQLNSPNVVKMYDVIQEPSTTYIILEFCNEGDLGNFIRNHGGHLEEAVAINVVQQLLKGFQNLIQMGFIHRDVKPANCLIKKGIHKLADFGFATKVDIAGRHFLKECVGTPLYMAPQLLEHKPYTAKSDIWSIGMLFYEMLFGKTPWPCRDLHSFLRNIQTIPLRFPYDKPIGNQTKKFIRQCLVIQEKDRMGWAQIFDDLLIKGQEIIKPENPDIILDQKSKKIFRKMQEIIQINNLDVNKIFDNFDKDKGGNLSVKEFYKMIIVIDPRITFSEAQYLFKKVDKSGDGEVSYEEFKHIFIDYDFVDINDKACQLITDIKEIIKANDINLMNIFKKFDADKTGSLDVHEFAELIRNVTPGLKDHEIQCLFINFDLNDDKLINFKEFKQKLAYGIVGLDENYDLDKEKAKKLIKELNRIIKNASLDIIQIFKQFDYSGDGILDLHEFYKLCKVIDKTMSFDDVKSVFTLFDPNRIGEISFEDFSQGILAQRQEQQIKKCQKEAKKQNQIQAQKAVQKTNQPLKKQQFKKGNTIESVGQKQSPVKANKQQIDESLEKIPLKYPQVFSQKESPQKLQKRQEQPQVFNYQKSPNKDNEQQLKLPRNNDQPLLQPQKKIVQKSQGHRDKSSSIEKYVSTQFNQKK